MKPKDPNFLKELTNLDAQLDKKAEAVDDMHKEMADDQNPPESKEPTIFDVIAEEGGPTEEVINDWKDRYSDKVYCVHFDKNDFYIYRYLSRAEYKGIVSEFIKVPQANKTDEMWDEMIVQKVLLYPDFTPELRAGVAAGTFETLRKQIMINSNFVPDEMAIRMIQKL